jgi:hypothetical protein
LRSEVSVLSTGLFNEPIPPMQVMCIDEKVMYCSSDV